jgi:hypothetical protein
MGVCIYVKMPLFAFCVRTQQTLFTFRYNTPQTAQKRLKRLKQGKF